ncbi:DUF3108 domain-containing protein [Microbacteriaceae bacterium K1510]|nr:DUF3108 domain-containing protein [Microbacteriaceae bacterium K1510]
MLASRIIIGFVVCGFASVVAAPEAARAQAKLEAQYSASLAGLPIGSGSWVIEIGDTNYSAAATGTTAGLLRAFTGGQGTTAGRGTLNGSRAMSSIYAATISTRRKSDEIRLTIANGAVKDFKVDPPQDDDPERVPLTEAHRQNVLDPMTASMVRMSGNGDLLTPDACQRKVSVFDGRLRYDLDLAFKRMDKVKADKGYAGPVVVCAIYFAPVAGFIPTRTAIKYLTNMRDMEVWLAPIAGTRVLVPFRAQGPTPIGEAVLEATQFVSMPLPTKAAVTTTPKTQ